MRGKVSNAGDVNRDGFDDIIIAAPFGDPASGSNAGESYVIFGKASGFAAFIDLATLDSADGFRLDGIDVDDGNGVDVSDAGDVNGDGYDDIVIGAGRADPNGLNAAGESYVVFGFDTGAVTGQGSAADDVINGGVGVDVLVGGMGADTLIGGGGLDVLRGGGGDDVLAIASDGFRVVNGGSGVDTLRLAGANMALDLTGVVSRKISAIEAVNLGSAGASIVVDAQAILQLSDTSNNLRITGDGSSTMTLQDAGWVIDADGGGTRTYSNGVAVLTVDRAIKISAIGDGGDGLLRGMDGNDTLKGGGGADELQGEDGDDILIGGLGNDILIGGAGKDRLLGKDGDDIMLGGSGNDLYTVTDTGDVVTELVGEGNDRINALASFTNPDHVEFLVGKFATLGLELTGSANAERIIGSTIIREGDTILGRGGDDVLIGLVGNDVINGGDGNDRIFGNSGFDAINGGAGNDVVTGQQGGDTFIDGLAAGRDRITDFNGAEDVIDLSAHGFADFAAVQAVTTDVSGSAIIDLDGVNSLKLQGVLEASLAANDFILA